MPFAGDRIDDLIAEASGRVAAAQDLETAVKELALVVAESCDLYRVSMRALSPDGQRLVIVALWSARATSLGVGSTMSVLSSTYPEIVERRSSIVHTSSDTDVVLDDILRAEGIRSWVSTPLRRGDVVWGLLSFSSAWGNAFKEEDCPVFDRLAAAVEDRLHVLLGSSTNRLG